jgi:adenylate cyclase
MPLVVDTDVAFGFGISLHLGEVIYGNVGVPERLQFTLVGSVVNEVVRVQDLTRELGCPLLATACADIDVLAASGQLRGRQLRAGPG